MQEGYLAVGMSYYLWIYTLPKHSNIVFDLCFLSIELEFYYFVGPCKQYVYAPYHSETNWNNTNHISVNAHDFNVLRNDSSWC